MRLLTPLSVTLPLSAIYSPKISPRIFNRIANHGHIGSVNRCRMALALSRSRARARRARNCRNICPAIPRGTRREEEGGEGAGCRNRPGPQRASGLIWPITARDDRSAQRSSHRLPGTTKSDVMVTNIGPLNDCRDILSSSSAAAADSGSFSLSGFQ